MKTAYERIVPDEGSSFKVIHWKADKDRFFWHQHPEYEIVYIHKGSGKRHIGRHVSYFAEGELMFIGPNVPHLNFGYGADATHEEIIVQLKDDFLGEALLKTPEFKLIQQLFERSKMGINFCGTTRRSVAKKMLVLPSLRGFERLIHLLNILQDLANSSDYQLLQVNGEVYGHSHREEIRIQKIYQFVERNYQNAIEIEKVADLVNLTVPSFCRYFKQVMNMTFTDFLNEYRINQACKILPNQAISDVYIACGFNNLSHFTKTFKNIIGKTPRDYRKQIQL